MNLGDIITTFEAADPNQVIRHGFHNPHSYRGDYYDLAFEPAENITVADMLEAARSAVGATYEGWKGGEFRMTEADWCWLSEEGSASGETISPLLLKFMLTPPVSRADILREAADVAERVAIKRHEQHEIEREQGALDVMTQLRRMADEAQPAAPAAVEPPADKTLDYRVGWEEALDAAIDAARDELRRTADEEQQ